MKENEQEMTPEMPDMERISKEEFFMGILNARNYWVLKMKESQEEFETAKGYVEEIVQLANRAMEAESLGFIVHYLKMEDGTLGIKALPKEKPGFKKQ